MMTSFEPESINRRSTMYSNKQRVVTTETPNHLRSQMKNNHSSIAIISPNQYQFEVPADGKAFTSSTKKNLEMLNSQSGMIPPGSGYDHHMRNQANATC